jgi:hypothetical protein
MSGKLNSSEIDQAKVGGLNFTANSLVTVLPIGADLGSPKSALQLMIPKQAKQS